MKLSNFLLSTFSLSLHQHTIVDRRHDLEDTLKELEPDLGFPRIKTYDFIIVGGGAAGSVLASKLSEEFTVLVLEAGGNPPSATLNTFLAGDADDAMNIYYNPDINFIYTSYPQKHAFLHKGGVWTTSAGRLLGGSGSHNGNMYNRGSPHDYDSFANLTQDDSFRYSNMLTYFKSFENFSGSLLAENERQIYYGNTGPVSVITKTPKVQEIWFKAGEELGYKIKDSNGLQDESFAPLSLTLRNRKKDSAFTAFLKPAMLQKRRNLRVLTYSTVEEVLFDGGKKAYGVAFTRHGMAQLAHASKEVIISAGVLGSPPLLFKSGIGPKTILEEAGIEVKVDLPGVGQGFMDHIFHQLRFRCKGIPCLDYLPSLREKDVETEIDKYQSESRSGFFMDSSVNGPQAFLVSSRAKRDGEEKWPDLKILWTPIAHTDVYEFALGIVVGRPKSVGYLYFNTSAYRSGKRKQTNLVRPNANYFNDPSDYDVLMEGIHKSLEIVLNTTAFSPMGVELVTETGTECDKLAPLSDEYWKCRIGNFKPQSYHFFGGCKFGSPTDRMAVVDTKFRGLRVIDASVFPHCTNANPNGPVMAMSLKAWESIREEHAKDDAHGDRSFKQG